MKPLSACCIVLLGVAAGSAYAQSARAPKEGQQVFDRWCAPCHGRAAHLPGTSSLTLKYKGRMPGALEDRRDLTRVAVKTFVRQGSFAMAPFRKTEIDDSQLESLATYLARR